MKRTRTLNYRRLVLNILFSVAILYILGWLSFVILSALSQGMNMNTYPADGTFQLYNPLRRIMLGQTPGLDFPFFHGIGVPWLHVPSFILFGQNVFAAEVSKMLVSPMLFIISSGIFFFAFFRKLKPTVVATALLLLASGLFIQDAILYGNSLGGLRSTFAILVAAALIWKTKRAISFKSFSIEANVLIALFLLGCAFIFGTEQGLAAIISYIIIRSVTKISRVGFKKSILSLVMETLIIALSTLLLLSLATYGHPLSALQYALVSIPADQSWYFGVPPNGYLTWPALLYSLVSPNFIVLEIIMLVGLVSSFALYKLKDFSRIRMVVIFLLLYGLIVYAVGITGYFAPGVQSLPLQKVMSILACLLVTYLIFRDVGKEEVLKLSGSSLVVGIMVIRLVSLILTINTFPIIQTLVSTPHATQASDYDVSSDQWKERLDKILPHIEKGGTVWSTYTSVFDSSINQLNPTRDGEDYIIHAVGDKRRKDYVEQFINEKPTYVISMRPSFFAYEEWLWSSTGSFYEQLFTHYDVIATTDAHVLWKYDDKKVEPAEAKTLYSSKNAFMLPANNTEHPVVYLVTVTYDAQSDLPFGVLGKIPRYFVKISGNDTMQYPVSLPNSKHTWAFPVVVEPGNKGTVLSPDTDGVLPSSLTISGANYRELSLPSQNRQYFIDYLCSGKTHKSHTECQQD